MVTIIHHYAELMGQTISETQTYTPTQKHKVKTILLQLVMNAAMAVFALLKARVGLKSVLQVLLCAV